MKVVSFGCRLNIYESELIKDQLKDSEEQNLIVFNTCAVTSEATRQAKQAIRKARKNNPEARIIVTGCGAQYAPQDFSNMPEVDKILGNQEKLSATNYAPQGPKLLVNDIMSVKETAMHFVTSFEEKTRAFLQIQNGCNHRCTFCMIPFARGNNRAVPIGAISEQVKALLDNGYKEVVFTGVDITDYGKDLPGAPTLAQMIKRVLNANPSLQRLRLSSIDVAEVDEELFELMAYEPSIMPYYHISVQSGDNMILKRMKRRHNRDQVIEFCNRLRSQRPEVSYGADLIAGFPTETEAMFEQSRKLIYEAGLHFLHVFPYSEREGTPAARMPQVEKKLRKARAKELIAAGQDMLKTLLADNLGAKRSILTQEESSGYTENFIKVSLQQSVKSNTIVEAKLTKVLDNMTMLAEVEDERN